jgi:CheY-specific phosphatase CheX
MNTIESKFKVGEHIGTLVTNVFQTMLALPVTPVPAAAFPPERISGAIGIGGETLNGTVYVHFSTSLATAAARAMLRLPPGEKISDGDVNDVVGELSNMVGAGLKSLLNDADIFCAVSTPSVIRGAFAVEILEGVTVETFSYKCLEQRFAVEVHMQIVE